MNNTSNGFNTHDFDDVADLLDQSTFEEVIPTDDASDGWAVLDFLEWISGTNEPYIDFYSTTFFIKSQLVGLFILLVYFAFAVAVTGFVALVSIFSQFGFPGITVLFVISTLLTFLFAFCGVGKHRTTFCGLLVAAVFIVAGGVFAAVFVVAFLSGDKTYESLGDYIAINSQDMDSAFIVSLSIGLLIVGWCNLIHVFVMEWTRPCQPRDYCHD